MSRLVIGGHLGDRFRILSRIGEGGMGAVYQALQLNLQREVALKVLHPEYAKDEEALTRFMREARVAAALKHPNAVEIYDVGTIDGIAYLSMEFLSGVTLRELVGEGQALSVPDALAVAGQLAEVLVAAHQVPLVHRDLKPENIFLEEGDGKTTRVVVVDFGLAFIEGDRDLGRLTREGLVIGTPAYLSPEQAQGITISAPSDIYSLGCVLYELVSGLLPFSGSELNVLTQHLYVGAMPPSQRVGPDAHIPGELDALVMDCLAKRPEDRPTAVDVRSRLDEIDAVLSGHRRRGRDDSYLLGRAARMISIPVGITPQGRTLPGDNRTQPQFGTASGPSISHDVMQGATVVALEGSFDEEIWLGLPSNGFHPRALGPEGDEADIIVTTEPDRLGSHLAVGVPVVVVATSNDSTHLAQLVKAGAAEILQSPVGIDDVVRKLRRALRRARRERKRTHDGD